MSFQQWSQNKIQHDNIQHLLYPNQFLQQKYDNGCSAVLKIDKQRWKLKSNILF